MSKQQKVVLKTTKRNRFGRSLNTSVGELKVSESGKVEVDRDTADRILAELPGFFEPQAEKGGEDLGPPDPAKEDTVNKTEEGDETGAEKANEDELNNGVEEDEQDDSVDMSKLSKSKIDNMNKTQLVELCEKAELPKDEWSGKNAKDLKEYLKEQLLG